MTLGPLPDSLCTGSKCYPASRAICPDDYGRCLDCHWLGPLDGVGLIPEHEPKADTSRPYRSRP